MKIVMLLTNGHTPDYRVEKECLSLIALGHSVTVLAWDRNRILPKREFVKGTEIVRCNVRCSVGKGIRQAVPFSFFYLWILFFLMTNQFDAIHCHDLDTLLVGFLAGRIKFKKIIYDSHEPRYCIYTGWQANLSRLAVFLERFLARRVFYVIATNPSHVKKFHDMEVTHVVEVANYPPKDIFPTITLSEKGEHFTFGTVASLRPQIGLELMIDGFKLLHSQVFDTKLIIAGPCSSVSYLQELRKRAGETEGIVFDVENNIKKMQERYQKLHVALLLYCPEQENYQMNTSTRLYESMAAKRAVITSDSGFTTEIVRREGCGLILDDYSPQALADTMLQLYRNRELTCELGQRGYDAFKRQYYWESNAKSLKKIYPVRNLTFSNLVESKTIEVKM